MLQGNLFHIVAISKAVYIPNFHASKILNNGDLLLSFYYSKDILSSNTGLFKLVINTHGKLVKFSFTSSYLSNSNLFLLIRIKEELGFHIVSDGEDVKEVINHLNFQFKGVL